MIWYIPHFSFKIMSTCRNQCMQVLKNKSHVLLILYGEMWQPGKYHIAMQSWRYSRLSVLIDLVNFHGAFARYSVRVCTKGTGFIFIWIRRREFKRHLGTVVERWIIFSAPAYMKFKRASVLVSIVICVARICKNRWIFEAWELNSLLHLLNTFMDSKNLLYFVLILQDSFLHWSRSSRSETYQLRRIFDF